MWIENNYFLINHRGLHSLSSWGSNQFDLTFVRCDNIRASDIKLDEGRGLLECGDGLCEVSEVEHLDLATVTRHEVLPVVVKRK